jgi:hypothetical protein
MSDRDFDVEVERLTKLVEKKKAELKKVRDYRWKTNLMLALPLLGEGRLNIRLCKERTLLAIAKGMLQNMLGWAVASSAAPVWQNYPIEDWVEDINTSMQMMETEVEEKKLAKLEKQLEALTSEDRKKQKALERVREELGL